MKCPEYEKFAKGRTGPGFEKSKVLRTYSMCRYMAHHYSLAIRQAFWKLPDVTHFRSPFYGPVHACQSAQRAINNIYRSLGVPATGIRLRHEYVNTLSTIHGHRYIGRWLFYNPQSFDAPPQGTLANIPNVPYISSN